MLGSGRPLRSPVLVAKVHRTDIQVLGFVVFVVWVVRRRLGGRFCLGWVWVWVLGCGRFRCLLLRSFCRFWTSAVIIRCIDEARNIRARCMRLMHDAMIICMDFVSLCMMVDRVSLMMVLFSILFL